MSAHRPAAAPVSGGPGWGRPRRRTVDWWDPAPVAEAAEGLSGLEFLRAVRDGGSAQDAVARGLVFLPLWLVFGVLVCAFLFHRHRKLLAVSAG